MKESVGSMFRVTFFATQNPPSTELRKRCCLTGQLSSVFRNYHGEKNHHISNQLKNSIVIIVLYVFKTSQNVLSFHKNDVCSILSQLIQNSRVKVNILNKNHPHLTSPSNCYEHVCMLSHFSRIWLFFNSMDCSPPGSSVHRILQTRLLEWGAMPSSRGSSSRGSSRPRDPTQVSCSSHIGRQILFRWATWEAVMSIK